MNLIIDIGNTNAKLAVFQSEVLLFRKTVKADAVLNETKTILNEFKAVKKSIVSSVGEFNKDFITTIKQQLDVLILNTQTPVPFKSNYKTPNTLGVDRIALVSAAVTNYPTQNILIIDAGSCITYDFVTNQSLYLGGAISPGIKMRYQSLHNLTANLPLLERNEPKNLIGNSSIESIHSGIINGVLMEIDGTIHEYEKKYKDLTVILTGGDADFLSKRLKSSIFANSIFLLEGLNFILEFNSN